MEKEKARTMKTAPMLLAFFALIVQLLLTPQSAMGQGPVATTVEGPEAVAPGALVQYNVTITGGPLGENRTYKVTWFLRGTDLTGAEPVEDSPRELTSATRDFTINVTAPQKEGTIQLVVTGLVNADSLSENSTAAPFYISVVSPITLSTTIVNSGAAAAVNLEIKFYVDDTYVGSKNVSSIEANGRTIVSFTWIPIDLSPGLHKLTVKVDLDRDGIIDPSKGEVVESDIFYKTTPEPSLGVLLVIAILILSVGFLLLAAVLKRTKKK